MAVLANPALWASLGAVLAALGIEMIPAQQLADHIVAAIAGISGIVGIIAAILNRSSQQQPAKPDEET